MRPSNAQPREGEAAAGLLYLGGADGGGRPASWTAATSHVVNASDADAVVDHVTGDVLGVDVEWPPPMQAAARRVLQIASKHACVVVRVGSATCLPPRTMLLPKRAICGRGHSGLSACFEGSRLRLRAAGRLEDALQQTRRGSCVVGGRVRASCTSSDKRDMSVRAEPTGLLNSRYRRSSTPPATPSHLIKWRSVSGGEGSLWASGSARRPSSPFHEPRPKPSSTTPQNDARARHKQERRANATRTGTRSTPRATTTTTPAGGAEKWPAPRPRGEGQGGPVLRPRAG